MATASELTKEELFAMEQDLGRLAMRFRGTSDAAERDAIAADYSNKVKRLAGSGHWVDMPAPEDLLPDERMPTEFYEYWSRQADG